MRLKPWLSGSAKGGILFFLLASKNRAASGSGWSWCLGVLVMGGWMKHQNYGNQYRQYMTIWKVWKYLQDATPVTFAIGSRWEGEKLGDQSHPSVNSTCPKSEGILLSVGAYSGWMLSERRVPFKQQLYFAIWCTPIVPRVALSWDCKCTSKLNLIPGTLDSALGTNHSQVPFVKRGCT